MEREEALFQKMTSFVFDEDQEVSLSFEVRMRICKGIATLLPRDHPMTPILDAVPNVQLSSLFLAAVFGIDGLLLLLAEHDNETDWNGRNERGHTVIYFAASAGRLSIVSILADRGADINAECGELGSPLHASCFNGSGKVVEELLKKSASSSP